MSSRFLNLLQRLARAGADFVIVGGYAGVVHGCARANQDVELCCDFSAANLLALRQALSDLHPVHRMTPGRQPLELTAANAGDLKNLYLDTDLGQLDCLSEIQGLGGYEQVKQASLRIEVEGIELRVLTLDALIKAKEAMHRPATAKPSGSSKRSASSNRSHEPGTGTLLP